MNLRRSRAYLASGQVRMSWLSRWLRATFDHNPTFPLSALLLLVGLRLLVSDGTLDAGSVAGTGGGIGVLQAYEAARDAGAKIPEGLPANLQRFLKTVWLGGSRFSYVAAPAREQPSLAGVGMLSLQILDPKAVEGELAGWETTLQGTASRGQANLYSVYYEVREELALRGELSTTRRAVLTNLPARMQQRVLPYAGMFAPTPVPRRAAPADPAVRRARATAGTTHPA